VITSSLRFIEATWITFGRLSAFLMLHRNKYHDMLRRSITIGKPFGIILPRAAGFNAITLAFLLARIPI
jgi:hypothetical protein